MRKESYRYCKDDLSKTHADILSMSLVVTLGQELVSLSTMGELVSVFPSYNEQQVIDKGQKLVALLERVLEKELSEAELVSEWEKVKNE